MGMEPMQKQPINKRKQPGATYGIKSHTWAALAVAVYAANKK
jgi:hypothetical protein